MSPFLPMKECDVLPPTKARLADKNHLQWGISALSVPLFLVTGSY